MKNRIVKMLYQAGFFFFVITCVLFSQQEKTRIACVGNSITEGSAISTKLLDAYPIALQRYLGSGYEVINCGVSGRTLLKKGDYPIWNEYLFDQAVNFNPNIVTIMLGTNDSKPYNWIYKNEFMKDYYAMIDSFKHGAANPEIYICLPLPSFSDAWDIRDSVIDADIIPMIKKIADSAKVHLIDFNTPFIDKQLLMPDGIHPLVEGSDLMARIFLKELTGREIISQKENDLALNKVAIQANNNLTELTDNNPETTVSFSSTSQPVVINLTDESDVDMIHVSFTNFSISGLSFSLTVSKDSLDWTTIIDTSVNKTLLFSIDKLSNFIKTFQSIRVKYIRFKINEGGIPTDSTILINQIKVFEQRIVHAPVWGWQLTSTGTQSIRAKVYTARTSNVGEYIKIYRQTKEDQPFYIYANYGSSVPLNFNTTINYGTLNRFYSVVCYNDVEQTSDTLTIISTKATDVKGSLESNETKNYTLSQNYPNPFNPETFIEFSIPKPENVTIEIFDVTGRLVRTIENQFFQNGFHIIRWDGMNTDGTRSASGVYFYRLKLVNKLLPMKKMVLLQ